MATESWLIGETIHNGEMVKVYENEDGYFIQTSKYIKYIDIEDYNVICY